VLRAGAGQVGSSARAVEVDGAGEDFITSMCILVRSSARTFTTEYSSSSKKPRNCTAVMMMTNTMKKQPK
jgi:hypothetical protein